MNRLLLITLIAASLIVSNGGLFAQAAPGNTPPNTGDPSPSAGTANHAEDDADKSQTKKAAGEADGKPVKNGGKTPTHPAKKTVSVKTADAKREAGTKTHGATTAPAQSGSVRNPPRRPPSEPTVSTQRVDHAQIDVSQVKALWPRTALSIPPLPKPPAIDGTIDEGIWDAAASGEMRYPDNSNEPVKSDTRFLAGYYDGVLYLLISYDWPKNDPPKTDTTTRDGDIHSDDGVEMFFHSVRTTTESATHQLLFNLAGVRADYRVQTIYGQPDPDMSWNPDWQVAVMKSEGKYIAEIALPLREIAGVDGKPGDVFRFNILRNRQRPKRSSRFFSPVAGTVDANPFYYGFAELAGTVRTGKPTTGSLAVDAPADILIPDTPAETVCLSDSPYNIVLLDPLNRYGTPDTTPKLHISLFDQAGTPVQIRHVTGAAFPLKIQVKQQGEPDGAYRLEVTVDGNRAAPFSAGFAWRKWVLVQAEDSKRCSVTGTARNYVYPRTADETSVLLVKGASITVHTQTMAAYLCLPVIFNSPGPSYGDFIRGTFRYRIDNRIWRTMNVFDATGGEIPLVEDMMPGIEHTITVEATGAVVPIDAFRFAVTPLARVVGRITTGTYSELLVDVRADVYRNGQLVRSDTVRRPVDSAFVINGLEPGEYVIRFHAEGWRSAEVSVSIQKNGEVVNTGVIILNRDRSLSGNIYAVAPRFGRSITVQPGGVFTIPVNDWRGGPSRAKLVNEFKTIDLKQTARRQNTQQKWTGVLSISYAVPESTPLDMYDLELIYTSGSRNAAQFNRQAVCVRKPLPKTFFIAGFGHMNTWGQKPAEYLKKVAETAQLAGARMVLISNEVNAAYVSGALSGLRIPYMVTKGNHTMARWRDFYSEGSQVTDDGPLRVVTFGKFPRALWEDARYLLNERASATCRVLLCYEAYVPTEIITSTLVDLVFDAHADASHPARDQMRGGALSLRAPTPHSLRWIAMTHDGVSDTIRSANDVPVLRIPRESPSPLRVSFQNPNDGSAHKQRITIINEFHTAFPAARVRAVMAGGDYGIDNGVLRQSFTADDSKRCVLDISVAVPAESRVIITVFPSETQK